MRQPATLLLISSILIAFSYAASNLTKGSQQNGRCTGQFCEFNGALRGGVKGGAGLRARLNSRMFRYMSNLLGELLSREIQHARLPDIVQSMDPLLDGRFVLHNSYVARYRCPQRVVTLTKSPNVLVLQLQNFDVGLNAVIDGHVKLMTPMVSESVVPRGVVRIDLQGVILAIELGLERGPRGPKMVLASCSNHIEKIDVKMEKGGKGSVSFLKKFVTTFVRDLIPNEMCKMIPMIIDQKINAVFGSLPQMIALKKLAAVTGLELFSAPNAPDPHFCSNQCGLPLSNVTSVALPGFPGVSAVITALAEAGQEDDKPRLPHSVYSLCSDCTASADANILQGFSKQLNLQKLTDMFLSVKVLNSSSNEEGLELDLSGEFSPKGTGGTPFYPHPTVFPSPRNKRMIEAIATDYTVNSLLYWAHRKGLMSFRVGPETPEIGQLLQTTCVAVESDEGEEMDDEEITLDKRRRRREAEAEASKESLTDLGLCLGDLLPEVRVNYPDEKFYIKIRSARAPSIILSAKNQGTASVDVQMASELFLAGNKTKVGGMLIRVQVNLAVHLKAQTLFGSIQINPMITDPGETLGLTQQSLDNIGSTIKMLVERHANDALAKGVSVKISQSPKQPANFYDLQSKIIDHGLYVAADVTIAPALLGTLGYSDSCYPF